MEDGSITFIMTNLVLQIGIIIFVVRAGGYLVKKIGIPPVLGELLAGVVIGPYALGGIPLPGFSEGLFPLFSETLAVSPELYAFSTVASIILLFASGLETDLGLFLKYSVAGGVIGLSGALFSFVLGDLCAVFLLHHGFMHPVSLFFGILSTATSVGITARILSDKKKMDSPEGVTTLAAAVFDDVLGIVLLAIVLGIVTVMESSSGGSLDGKVIGLIALKAFGIWLGFTILGLVFSKQIAGFLKLFKHSYDFSIAALGIGLLLAGVFEKQGLAMIIGAYVTGLSISKTDIAAVIQERIHGLYEFFVPLFFCVMGMMVNVGEMLNMQVLVIGLIYTIVAVLAKVLGCGIPALSLGFNIKGAVRIGVGMLPRGEVALIIAGIGLSAGILNQQMFGITILMTLITTVLAAPLLNAALNIKGRGTRKEAKADTNVSLKWDFKNDEIADLVVDSLLKNLKDEGFYVQMMNIDDGISQARKNDIALSIIETESLVSIETSAEDAAFVKTSVYEVLLKLTESMENLTSGFDPLALKKEMAGASARMDPSLAKMLDKNTISINLEATTKDEILKELVLLATNSGHVIDWQLALKDVIAREKSMSTGMQKGIALPHAKTDGVIAPCIAIGIKKEGIDFESLDQEASRLFVLILSPKKTSSPHIQVLSTMASVLHKSENLEALISAKNPQMVKDSFLGMAKTSK